MVLTETGPRLRQKLGLMTTTEVIVELGVKVTDFRKAQSKGDIRWPSTTIDGGRRALYTQTEFEELKRFFNK